MAGRQAAPTKPPRSRPGATAHLRHQGPKGRTITLEKMVKRSDERTSLNAHYSLTAEQIALIRKTTVGVWSLIVRDRVTGNTGTIDHWSLTLTPAQ